MPIASNNPFPSMLYVEQGSTPANPPSGDVRLFVRSSDHVLCKVDSAGVVTALSGALTNPMTTKGDIILGDTGGTPTRLGAGTATYVLTSAGAGAFPTWSASAATSPSTVEVVTDQSTASSSYTDLATTGPAVTVTIGASGLALVMWCAQCDNTASFMSVAVSGATTTAASDDWAMGSVSGMFGTMRLFTGLAAGSTTFTAKYRAGSGTVGFQRRKVVVHAF